jgi:chromosome segregation ATPase
MEESFPLQSNSSTDYNIDSDNFLQEISSSYKDAERMASEILKLRNDLVVCKDQLKSHSEGRQQAEIDAAHWKARFESEEEKLNHLQSKYSAELMEERNRLRLNFEKLLECERDKYHLENRRLQQEVNRKSSFIYILLISLKTYSFSPYV